MLKPFGFLTTSKNVIFFRLEDLFLIYLLIILVSECEEVEKFKDFCNILKFFLLSEGDNR